MKSDVLHASIVGCHAFLDKVLWWRGWGNHNRGVPTSNTVNNVGGDRDGWGSKNCATGSTGRMSQGQSPTCALHPLWTRESFCTRPDHCPNGLLVHLHSPPSMSNNSSRIHGSMKDALMDGQVGRCVDGCMNGCMNVWIHIYIYTHICIYIYICYSWVDGLLDTNIIYHINLCIHVNILQPAINPTDIKPGLWSQN